MDHIDTLVKRLRAYSQSLVAYKLDADFADACTEVADALEKLQAQNSRLNYSLMGVMHSVDKWLEGDELNADEVQRAATMREKTLGIVEKLQAELRQYENLDEQLSDECALRDEIAELKAENDKMRPFYTTADTHFKLWEKTAMDAYEERNRAKAELEKLQAKLDRVTLERDAAVDDLRAASIEGDMECNWCAGKTDRTQCYNCSFANKWKWSGLKEA